MYRKFAPFLIATIFATTGFSSPAISQEIPDKLKSGRAEVSTQGKKSDRKVTARILINASPEIVWDTVHKEREKDPDIAYSKVLKKENNQLTLEQKFALLPVIGTATCTMLQEEVPLRSISYKLLKSDHFKAMHGSWVLTHVDQGRKTILELSSHLELGVPIPQPIMDAVTAKKLEKRLERIRNMAEEQAKMANSSSAL